MKRLTTLPVFFVRLKQSYLQSRRVKVLEERLGKIRDHRLKQEATQRSMGTR
jgi:hypothetical protein